MNKIEQQLIITALFVVVLTLLLNPFGFFMPNELMYIMLGAVLVLFGVYMSFVLSENPKDEREQLHRYIANRSAYVWGSVALVVGIIYQGISDGQIDNWLLIVLGVMVISKVASLYYSDKHK